MSKLFISYRRADASTEAQLIAKQMRERYGEESVFFDVHSILKGVDFQEKIDASVSKCDVLLAVIGDRWIDARFDEGERKGQRRLDDPKDFVRIEVASALKRDIPVIPVLIGKVSMSDLQNKLPTDLADLTKRNAACVRPGSDLDNDLQALVVDVRKVANLKPLTPDELSLPSGVSVVPKGLRAFDENDAGFFLSLLPGPRREGGLPDSIYFWKSRIEETDADKTFNVGLLYGPSGCGKSSLVKAGLIPHLSDQVTPVYVEATPTDTEKRLLARLKKHCPYLTVEDSLRATLRQKNEIPAGQKVLIVLDQFEQYLHSTPFDEQRPLIDALNECDGERFQCIVMVRDDFITVVNRFMNALGIALAENENYSFVDLFDKRHAKKVLAMFGQAFDKLPKSGEFAKEQNDFLNQAVSELLEEDFVICVRLALFAQMVRAKEWTSKTFKSFGGAKGVGKLFFEESFTAKTAPLENRRHQAGARKFLSCLLPEHGSDIKGAMRSRKSLLEQSGYARRPADFEQLLEILDSKLRLITPTEAVVVESEDAQPADDEAAEKYYQLTHDYLVPSLREWLTQEQEKTRRGRAEIRLAKRSALWNAEPERRHLPAWWEHINIRLFSRRKNWTEPQNAMMRAAAWHHGAVGLALMTIFVLLGWSGYEITGKLTAKNLVNDLKAAPSAEVASKTIDKLSSYSRFVIPLLEDEVDQPAPTRKPSGELSKDTLKQIEDRARFASALLHLGHDEKVWPLFKVDSPDPTGQTHLIHRLAELGVRSKRLFERLEKESDDSISMALILTLGEAEVVDDDKEEIVRWLKERYENDPHSGIHGATGWLLRRWGRGKVVARIDARIAAENHNNNHWFVSKSGLTMVEISGQENHTYGGLSTTVGRKTERFEESRLFFSQCEITQSQYLEVMGENPSYLPLLHDYPVENVSWLEAIAFCNKLSELDGFQPFYVIDEQNVSVSDSDRNGYRLPTEAEWQIACNAGTASRWSFGDDEAKLSYYAWWYHNSNNKPHPVGGKKPNSIGLSDMHGNVYEWCWDVYEAEAKLDATKSSADSLRVVIGGSFANASLELSSAFRGGIEADDRVGTIGFRVARNCD